MIDISSNIQTHQPSREVVEVYLLYSDCVDEAAEAEHIEVSGWAPQRMIKPS